MQIVFVLLAIVWIVPQTLAKDSCAGQPFGSRAVDPQDPYSYVLCLGLLGQIRITCHEGLKFDAASQACVVEKKELQTPKKETKNELKIEQEIKVDRPVIFNIFGNLNFFGSLWGSSQEATPSPLTGDSIPHLQFSNLAAEVQPQSTIITIQNVDNTSKDQAIGSEKLSSSGSLLEENGSTTESPDSEISTEDNLSSESTTEENGNSEISTTEAALESSTEDGILGSENLLIGGLSLEIPSTPQEDNGSLENPTTDPSPESTTEDSISSSVNPLELDRFLEKLAESSTEENLSSEPSEENPTTESSSEGTTEDSISSSVNPLELDRFLEKLAESSTEENVASSENPSTDSTSEDNGSSETTEPSSESTEAGNEGSISSSENPLVTEPSEESTTLADSGSSESSVTEPSQESSTQEDNVSSEWPPLESTTQEDNSSSESPVTEVSLASTSEEGISSSEPPLVTDPSQESTIQDNRSSESPVTEPFRESTTEESISSSEPSQETTIQDNRSSESPVTEPSRESTTEDGISSSENPSPTEPSLESTTQEDNVSSQSPALESTTQGDNSSPESPVTNPPLESTTEESLSSSENPVSTESSVETTTQDNRSSECPVTSPSLESTTKEDSVSSESPVTEPSQESTTQNDNGSDPVTEPSLTTTSEKDNGSSESPVTKPSPESSTEESISSSEKPAVTEPSQERTTKKDNGSAGNPATAPPKESTECPDVKPKEDGALVTYLKESGLSQLSGLMSQKWAGKKPKDVNATICTNLPNGVFLRDPTSCNKFYICLNGKPRPGNCPSNLNFDIKNKVCNYPSLVDCSIDEKPEVVTKKPSEDNNTLDCRSLHNGAYIRDPTSCSKFYVCANGRAIARECPRGLYFDFTFNFCNYPGQVKCSIGESSAGSHRPPNRASVPDCSKAADGTRFGDIKMRNKYYSCRKGKAVLNYCSAGMWFDAEKQKCIDQRLMIGTKE
ncbi:uncharacterized protein Dana_GF24516 [Drosophila ananassae]|uniref:Chitin-binding type-2 domain-containing protein n=1 Tax=Drosophila ananassae TaxID=7217 RepID=B3M4C2_DROAN|nr:serine-rich adhesin for platelets [Drosophila ananassae]EDV39392.1 uncharacterized protein Dana_GF24516 [Drosophila ananassae]